MKDEIKAKCIEGSVYKITRGSDVMYERLEGLVDFMTTPCCNDPECGGSKPRRKSMSRSFGRDAVTCSEKTLFECIDRLMDTESALYATIQSSDSCLERTVGAYKMGIASKIDALRRTYEAMTEGSDSEVIAKILNRSSELVKLSREIESAATKDSKRRGFPSDEIGYIAPGPDYLGSIEKSREDREHSTESRIRLWAGEPDVYKGHPDWSKLALLEIESSQTGIKHVSDLLREAGYSMTQVQNSFSFSGYEKIVLCKLK